MDLREAVPGELKERLTADGQDPEVLLGVQEMGEDPRYVGERLSLADTELSLMERRMLVWRIRRLFGRLAGKYLRLEVVSAHTEDQSASARLAWSVEGVHGQVESRGAVDLSLRKTPGGWRIVQIARVIAALDQGLAAAQGG